MNPDPMDISLMSHIAVYNLPEMLLLSKQPQLAKTYNQFDKLKEELELNPLDLSVTRLTTVSMQDNNIEHYIESYNERENLEEGQESSPLDLSVRSVCSVAMQSFIESHNPRYNLAEELCDNLVTTASGHVSKTTFMIQSEWQEMRTMSKQTSTADIHHGKINVAEFESANGRAQFQISPTSTYHKMHGEEPIILNSEGQYKVNNAQRTSKPKIFLPFNESINQFANILLPDKRRYECMECRKLFSSAKTLKCHQGVHSGVKPFQCKLCAKHFRRPEYLSLHLRIHAGEKTYLCEFCGSTWYTKSKLSLHAKIHAN